MLSRSLKRFLQCTSTLQATLPTFSTTVFENALVHTGNNKASTTRARQGELSIYFAAPLVKRNRDVGGGRGGGGGGLGPRRGEWDPGTDLGSPSFDRSDLSSQTPLYYGQFPMNRQNPHMFS